MAVRFIHTADLHLGKTFEGLTSSSEKIGSSLKHAVQETFKRIIDLALARRVDFVIVAGDIFESPQVSYAMQREFSRQLARLGKAGIAAYLCTGNHDYLSGWGVRINTLPANVVMFDTTAPQRVEHMRDGNVVAVLYGQSYLDHKEPRDLAAGMRAEASDPLSIGVVHADLLRGEAYAPTSLSTLKAAGMDYWALGHIHKHEVLSDAPPVVYPGSPQGLNINESSVHGCYYVELEEHTQPLVEFTPTSQITWERLVVDCSLFSYPEDLETHLVELAKDKLSSTYGNICARIKLTGRSALHERLREEGLLEDIAAVVWGECESGSTWFWIDSITDETQGLLDEEKLRESGLFTATFLEHVESAAAPARQEELKESLSEDLYSLLGKGSRAIVHEMDFETLLAQAKTRALDELMSEVG